jgi:hypothetical protein
MRRALLALLVGALLSGIPPASAGGRQPWPIGSIKLIGTPVSDCPEGFACTRFQNLDCPGVRVDMYGEFAMSAPAGPPRGLVMFFDGGGGHEWWADPGPGMDFLAHLRDDDGFIIMEMTWGFGWFDAANGERTGPAHLGCRPASALQWVHDHVYLPLGLDPPPGQCGFCLTGNSGGSSAATYPLAFYGQDTLFDAVIPTGGPDHAAITKACLQVPGYEFNDAHRNTIDYSYGWLDPGANPGPCHLEDQSWAPTWDADSIDLGGNDFSYPDTRVEFVEGGLDDTAAPAHAADYRDRLLQDPNNRVVWNFIPNMPHHISDNLLGQAAIEASLVRGILPVTTISTGPSDPTNDTTATFDFSADDPTATFTCSLDGAASSPCTSPVTYASLADVAHQFTVHGTNSEGVGPAGIWNWTVDVTAPALVPGGLQMLDTDANGRIDRVIATFDETLAAYTAGNAPWTLASVPSNGSLSAVSVSGSTATLSIVEGSGAADTAVGAFTLALTGAPGGIADPAGNRSSFGPRPPVDLAGPVPVKVGDVSGSVNGRIQPGDKLQLQFSEALLSSSVPASVVVAEVDPAGPGNDLLRLGGIAATDLDTGSDAYVTLDGGAARFASSPVALSNSDSALTVTVASLCAGACSARAPGGPAPFVFMPASSITDPAGNSSVGSYSIPSFKLF